MSSPILLDWVYNKPKGLKVANDRHDGWFAMMVDGHDDWKAWWPIVMIPRGWEGEGGHGGLVA